MLSPESRVLFLLLNDKKGQKIILWTEFDAGLMISSEVFLYRDRIFFKSAQRVASVTTLKTYRYSADHWKYIKSYGGCERHIINGVCKHKIICKIPVCPYKKSKKYPE